MTSELGEKYQVKGNYKKSPDLAQSWLSLNSDDELNLGELLTIMLAIFATNCYFRIWVL